jgi:hypothetical protein
MNTPLHRDVIEARIAVRLAELRVLAARVSLEVGEVLASLESPLQARWQALKRSGGR